VKKPDPNPDYASPYNRGILTAGIPLKTLLEKSETHRTNLKKKARKRMETESSSIRDSSLSNKVSVPGNSNGKVMMSQNNYNSAAKSPLSTSKSPLRHLPPKSPNKIPQTMSPMTKAFSPYVDRPRESRKEEKINFNRGD
jgi:hypothetical protein